MNGIPKKILVIDDEEMVVNAICAILTDMDYHVTGVTDPVKGEAIALQEDFSLILVDLVMPGRNGAEIVQTVLSHKPETRILIISAHAEDRVAQEAIHSGALGIMKKPFEIGMLLDFLKEGENR